MPFYGFEIIDRGACRQDGNGLLRLRVTTELPNREAAREFAIEMAESLLAEQDDVDERSSTIAITDQEGDELDVIHSIGF